MQSKATTVSDYLATLPANRRAAIASVRDVILRNLDKGFEEGMQYGMIGYYVPHRTFPAGYHCDPKQPLPFAALASQKNYMSVYLMSAYYESGDKAWLREQFKKAGKRLDMGKCCIRFKRLEDLPLNVIGEAFRRVTAKKYVQYYAAAMQSMNARKQAQPAKRANPATKQVASPGKRKAAGKGK